jgi:hypothetical protein
MTPQWSREYFNDIRNQIMMDWQCKFELGTNKDIIEMYKFELKSIKIR